MLFLGIIVILILVHFLIIRPLTQRNRPQIYDRSRNYYEPSRGDYGPYNRGRGFGGVGTFAGGLAAGALLTYLFEQGRIGFDQYSAWQHLEDHEIMRELMDQNILQEHEIAQLQEEIGGRGVDDQEDWNVDRSADNQNPFDNTDEERQDQSDFGDWDNGKDDNWV